MHRLLEDFSNTRQLLALRNCYRGQQAVVLCPGASLDEVDLSLLEGHSHLQGANGFFARWTLPFRHYFCSSVKFYRSNQQAITQLPCERWFLARYMNRDGREDWTWPDERVTTRVTINIPHFDAPPSANLLRVLPWGPTVLFDLILPSLVWMGYDEIILLGTDYSAQNYRYCAPESSQSQAWQSVVQPQGISLQERVDEIELAHQRARQWALWGRERRSRTRIVNCAPGSQLPGFERGNLENYVSKLAKLRPQATPTLRSPV